MRLRVLAVGRDRSGLYQPALEEYARPLGRYARFEVVEVPEARRHAGTPRARDEEGETLLSGFRVAVSDDREEFCNPDSVPGADAYYPVSMAELPNQLKVTPQTFLVVTSRGSAIDAAGLPPLLGSDAAYIGVIGSKRRWLTTVKALKEKGVAEDRIARVHSPMGLELNAETPEEIAISILAEILMLRDRGTGRMMKD